MRIVNLKSMKSNWMIWFLKEESSIRIFEKVPRENQSKLTRGTPPSGNGFTFIFSPSLSRNFNKVLSQTEKVWLITNIKIWDKEKIKVKR